MSTKPTGRELCPSHSKVPNPLKELVQYLDGLTERASVEKLEELLTSLEITRDDLINYAHFGPQTYRRNLICEGEWYELLCICWQDGQRSPIHNHAGSTCGLRIIHGIATETLFEWTDCGQIKAVESVDAVEGHVCSSQDADVHQVSNLQAAGKDLMTLHIYSPALRTMDTYSLLGEVSEYRPTNFMSCLYADGI